MNDYTYILKICVNWHEIRQLSNRLSDTCAYTYDTHISVKTVCNTTVKHVTQRHTHNTHTHTETATKEENQTTVSHTHKLETHTPKAQPNRLHMPSAPNATHTCNYMRAHAV